jgi:hypothetical protein
MEKCKSGFLEITNFKDNNSIIFPSRMSCSSVPWQTTFQTVAPQSIETTLSGVKNTNIP